MMKITRIYAKPTSSIFLLGPRGTGKSTFVREQVKPELTLDLLKTSLFRQLSLHPSQLEEMVAHLRQKQWVFIDEVQKVPELLDEVHRLIEERGLRFVLTGSSARKLKKEGVNLLAGRALSKKMYPITLRELGGQKKIETLLEWGLLPRSLNEDDRDLRHDFLFSYVNSYLKEEIFQEGLTRNLAEFSQFVEIAGQYQGQILNYENIAREVGKSGDTIQSWFQILEDTLVGYRIPPYPLHLFARESKHPRFYYFDCGIARAAEGLNFINDAPERRGFYFETIILNELKTYLEVSRKNYKIYYYSVTGQGDMDFLVEIRRKSISAPAQLVGIEVKLGKKWTPEFDNMAHRIHQHKKSGVVRMVGVYLGDTRLTRPHIEIYPLVQFVENLWSGNLF